MTIRISELLDNGMKLHLTEILSRLQTQKDTDAPDYSIVRACLLETKPYKDRGEQNPKDVQELIEGILAMAQGLLEKEAEEAPDTKEESLVEKILLADIHSLKEATVTQSGQNVETILIEEGWSANGRYYPRKVIEALPGLLGNAGKIFLNHLITDEQVKKGRDIRDWAAQIEEATVVPSPAHAGKLALAGKIHIFDRPAGFLQERVMKYPDQVGLSISAFARLKEGKAENRKGMIVEEVTAVESFDFVDRPAAGGRVLRIAAGLQLDELAQQYGEKETEVSEPEYEAIMEDLKKIVRKADDREKYWTVRSALDTAFREIAALKNKKDDAKKKLMASALDEFKGLMLELPLVDMFKQGSTYESITRKEEGVQVEFKDLDIQTLATERPDLLESLKSDWETELAESKEAKDRDAEHKTLVEENKALKDQKKDSETQSKVAERKELVEAKITEAKLPEWLVDDTFRADLMEAKDEAEIDVRVKRQTEIFAKSQEGKAGGVKGNGPTDTQPGVKTEESKDDDTEKKVDAKAIVEAGFTPPSVKLFKD